MKRHKKSKKELFAELNVLDSEIKTIDKLILKAMKRSYK